MKPIFAILILIATFQALASPSMKLQIMFEEGTSPKIKDELHKKMGSRLEYRGASLDVDFVTFKVERSANEAAKSCREYLKSPYVRFCEKAVKLEKPPTLCEQLNILSGTVKAPLSREVCDVLPATPLSTPAGLHPLWSQMRIGSDLVRSEVSQRMANGESFLTVGVGNIDGGFSHSHSDARGDAVEFITQSKGLYKDHGTKVVNLIAGKGNHGASANAQVTFVRDAYSESGQFIKAMDDAISNKPEILNLEVHTLCLLKGTCEDAIFGTGDIAKAAILKAAKDMIVVAAAGNYYPEGSPDAVLEDESVIIVGSSDPYGLISGFSDESPDVTILAPSDEHQRVPGIDGDGFGGTSGATPLVSAVVADVKSVLSELNGKEAAKILKMSSTKLHITNVLPQRNGAGQLNSYRALKLADRLKAEGWPNNREELLVRAESWDFKANSLEELSRAKEALMSSDCDSYKKAFTALRKAFLLDETNEEVRTLLTLIYQAQKYPTEAQYLRNFESSHLSSFISNSGAIDYTCEIPGCFTPPMGPVISLNGVSSMRANMMMQNTLASGSPIVSDPESVGNANPSQ